MRLLRYTDAAEDQLEALFEYIADRSDEATGRHFIGSIVDRCTRIAALPGLLGTARPDLAPKVRSTPHRGYTIYFRYGEDVLEVVAVLDAHRDALAYFE